MEYLTIQKNISSSPRKLRLVADMVRKMQPRDAINTLQFTQRAAAEPLYKAIKTALANAGKENVVFKSIEINEGMKLKRYKVGTAGRGRGRPYKRRWSHIKVVLTDELIEMRPEKAVKSKKVKSEKNENLKVEEKKGKTS